MRGRGGLIRCRYGWFETDFPLHPGHHLIRVEAERTETEYTLRAEPLGVDPDKGAGTAAHIIIHAYRYAAPGNTAAIVDTGTGVGAGPLGEEIR